LCYSAICAVATSGIDVILFAALLLVRQYATDMVDTLQYFGSRQQSLFTEAQM